MPSEKYWWVADGGPLRRVLREWIRINEALAEYWDWKDCPWWCNEQASVSTLAAAVWKAGGLALADYSDEKIFRRAKYQGRVDLYAAIDGQNFVIEAKHIWPRVSSRLNSFAGTLTQGLAIACDDARCVSGCEEKQLGLVFAVPRIPKSEDAHVSEILSELQSQFLRVEADARAWVFPKSSRSLVGKDSFLYPGVALLFREA